MRIMVAHITLCDILVSQVLNAESMLIKTPNVNCHGLSAEICS